MRKKLFVGIAVFAMVFSTCMTGYAQILVGPGETPPACHACSSAGKVSCAIRNIPANNCLAEQDATNVFGIFDWDDDYGFCTDGQTSCTLRFNLCECDNCEFKEGWVMGIQLKILTPGVFWAGDANMTAFGRAGQNCYSENTYNLAFRRFAAGNGCTPTNLHNAADTNNKHLRVAYYANETAANADSRTNSMKLTGPGTGTTATVIRTPTPYDGWEISQEDVGNNWCEWQIDMPAMIASRTTTAQAGSTVQVEAKLLFTPPLPVDAQGYANTSYLRQDPELTDTTPALVTDTFDWAPGTPPYQVQGQFWQNDPDITNDPLQAAIMGYDKEFPVYKDCTEFPDGAGGNCCPVNTATHPVECDPYYAQNTVDALGPINATYPDGFAGSGACLWKWEDLLCEECHSCKCITDIGILCCQAPAAGTYCVMYPYVLFGYSDWSSGIGLNRLCETAAGNASYVELALTDCTGATFTHRIDGFENCLGEAGMTIDQMISEYGWNPNPNNNNSGQGWLKVTSNFPLDGYQFNMYNDGSMVFGAGVLAEACWNTCIRGTSDTKFTR